MLPLITLTYFDRIMGPKIFHSFPENKLKEETAAIVRNLMDQIISEGFFTYSFNSSYTLNYYFEIDSDWARGNKEFLMISIIFNQPPQIETEKAIFTLCNEFSEWLKTKDEIFTAFYKNSYSALQNNKIKIEESLNFVIDWIKELYVAVIDEIQEKIEKTSITSLLEKENVLATLKLLSDHPVPIRDLKEWYIEKFPHNNFHRLITSLFRNQIVYIPKIGGRKNTPFYVHVAKEIKTITNLLILKNKLLKKFLENNSTKDTDALERNTKQFHKFLERVFSEKQVV